jgi:hypothetical protein
MLRVHLVLPRGSSFPDPFMIIIAGNHSPSFSPDEYIDKDKF